MPTIHTPAADFRFTLAEGCLLVTLELLKVSVIESKLH